MAAPYSPEIQIHLKRLAIDEKTIEHAKAAWTVIRPHLPRLIDEFYRHLFATGGSVYFRDVQLPKIKISQFTYWRSLFSGEFDAAYQAHAGRIGSKHRRAGIELSHYIAAYSWFSEHLFRLIARVPPPKPLRTHDVFVATNKIIYLDMIIATKGAAASSAANAEAGSDMADTMMVD